METCCYIDLLKKIIVEKRQIEISGQDLFVLLNCASISYENWKLGYDYKTHFCKRNFIQEVKRDCDVLAQTVARGIIVLCFVNTRELIYNNIYKTSPGKIHCVQVLNVYTKENKLVIRDSHVRINDVIFKEQIAELSTDVIKMDETALFAIDIEKLIEEARETCNKEHYGNALKTFVGTSEKKDGIQAVEMYLNYVLDRINLISQDMLLQEMKQLYYDIKINSLLFVNYYMNNVICDLCKISKSTFKKEYVEDIEKMLQKIMYYAYKGEKEKIFYYLKELLNVCKKERMLISDGTKYE